MTTEPDDRNALVPQNPVYFMDVTESDIRLRARLTELAILIPQSDAVGAELNDAWHTEHNLRAQLDIAVDTSRRLAEKYQLRLALMEEERDLLQDHGLTQNLFRQHKPDYSAGEGLD